MTHHPKVWLALASVAVGAAVACGTVSSPGGSSSSGGSTFGSLGAMVEPSGSNEQRTGATGNDASGGADGPATSGAGAIGGGTAAGESGGASGSASSGTSAGGTGASGSGVGTTSGASGASSDAGAPPLTPHMGNTCLKVGSGDYAKNGPYSVMIQTGVDLGPSEMLPDTGPTTYTIFYPQPFETSCPHPVVAWGNGTGVTGYDTYQFFNNNAASWGIVVIASDNSNVGSGVYHKAAIDYMVKQNSDPKSIFYKRLSTRVGTSGHSQAGGATTGANLIGPSCEAEVCVAGGGSPAKTNAFICLTGSADLNEHECTAAYNAAPGQAFLADWDGGNYTTTETVAGFTGMAAGTIQMMRLYAAWFRCFLADDQVACKLFEGGAPNNCGICKDPGWHVLSSKNL